MVCLSHSLSLILLLVHFSSSFSSTQSCARDQSLSLLQFKQSSSINSSASWRSGSYPKTVSWKEGTDCCLWDGVTCDMETGQVTELNLTSSMLYGSIHSNTTLFSLHHLRKLDLSGNAFNFSSISSQFGQFPNLTLLFLNYSIFTGQVPSEISHLSNLVSLDLSSNYGLSLEPVSFDKLVRNLTKLELLRLDGIDMFLVVPNSLRNLSFSLSSLSLSNCGLQGKIRSEISHLSNLVSLDLSSNYNLSLEPISFDKLVRNLTKLELLKLDWIHMSLVVPNSLRNLSSSLSSLSLSDCGLQGKFRSEISHLSNLVSLDLSWNNGLSLEPISFDKLVRNLTKLELLKLDWINMSLVVPNSLRNLSSSLSSLSLWNCGLRGKFPSDIFFLRPNLESLDLSYNEGLTGSFLSSNVSSVLRLLHLSYTNISIYLENDFFNNQKSLEVLRLRKCNIVKSNLVLIGNLTQLIDLDLSDNNLRGQIPSSLISLMQLNSLNLSSNDFTGRIPDFLGNMNQLEILDLSNNQLIGPIPSNKSAFSNLRYLFLFGNLLNGTIPSFFFTSPSLQYLYLHNNLFTGNINEFQHSSLERVDLSNNHLHGTIPSSIFKQEQLRVLNLASNNKLTGEIPSSICDLAPLLVLDLSNNSLSGSLPQCLANFSNSISVLHLGRNNLQGTLPLNFLQGNGLTYLSLNDNELEGEIPTSIINCTNLEAFDVGNNKIEGTFPYFLETLPELQVLVLKSNKLQGFVKGPTASNSFHKLRIFDISNNNLSGPFPKDYFNSLEGMMVSDQNMVYMGTKNYTTYEYSIGMTWKGSEMEFAKIQSTLSVLDFSNNNFEGEIPEFIGKLRALQQLNLSHNSLTGHIQSSLGMLTKLESLDLSSNLLTGRIPMQLADLTFLQVLNLSHNHLKGPIPTGKQFNTFLQGSFEGNLDLCGFPMPKECNKGEAPPLPPSNFHEGDNSTLFGDGFGWKAVALGYGCGFVFGVTIGYIVFRTRKPAWFLMMVEDHWNLQAKGTKKKARRNSARRN